MSEEVLVTQRKRKRTKYPFLEPKVEETEEQYSTQDQEPERRIRARGVYYEIEDAIKKANDQTELQKELLRQKQRETEDRLFTARNALTKTELGNVARVVLSDQTITLGKGTQHQRRHRKILGGLYHADQEESISVEFRRSGSEEQ